QERTRESDYTPHLVQATPQPAAPSPHAAAELGLDVVRVEAACREQHVGVEPEVGELLDEPLVALGRAGECGLDAFLSDLACRRRRPLLEQLRHVGTFRALLGALCNPPP